MTESLMTVSTASNCSSLDVEILCGKTHDELAIRETRALAMDRRLFLAASTVGGLSAASPAAARTKSPTAPTPINPGIDRARTQHILGQWGLDAIILARPENVYYATGNWPLMSRLGVSDASFAIIPADSNAPIKYVTPQFAYYYATTDAGLSKGVEPHLVTGHDGGKTANAFFYQHTGGGELPAREERRKRKTEAAAPYYADSAAALAGALAKSGVKSGRVGYDSWEAQHLLAASASGAQGVASPDVIKTMRLIKTPFEIELMKAASKANVAAARKTAMNMRNLGTINNARNDFNAEASRLGNTPKFMVVNGAVDEAYDEQFENGTSVLIDCVSSLKGYHGDYGRTIFIGEPRQAMAAKVRAMGLAWNELRNRLKPGVRFSDVRSEGALILKKMGQNINVPFNPHCVGLAHTEQPTFDYCGTPIDTILEPGMIISVDCPLMEASNLGTAHLEDLTLITADGHAPIHDIGNNFILV